MCRGKSCILRQRFVMNLIVLHLPQGTYYLTVMPQKSSRFHIIARSDDTGGTLNYYSPKYGWSNSVDIGVRGESALSINPSRETSNDVEYKVTLIACSNNNAFVWVSDRYMAFAPLPVTALGTKYIVSSCHHSYYSSLLVIVAYNVTSISINARSKIFGPSFNRTDTYLFQLDSFQTFAYVYSDLTGTVVTSTQSIAVFSGMISYEGVVMAYEQLLPVRLYDKEYNVDLYDYRQSSYYIQILSEHNDTVITFNNGVSLTINSSVYQTQRMFPRFHFKSTNPVTVTLCKPKWQYSAFIVVPPISLCAKICTAVFTNYNIHAEGITYKQPYQIGKEIISYCSAILDEVYLHATEQSKGASYQVAFPRHNWTQTRQIQVSASDIFFFEAGMAVQYGYENKAILVNVDTEDIQLSVVIGSQDNLMWVFDIFPASLLGREYRLQGCYGNKPYELRLITVSSSSETDVNILLSHPFTYHGHDYKPGDTIREHLQPYQTLTINSYGGLCGSRVSASHNVAVYIQSTFGTSSSFTQLLAVKTFGNEYIVAANDEALNFNNDYYMIVTSAGNLTEVEFNHDVKVILGNGISCRKDLGVTESVYFSSTKPVTTSLCNFHSHQCTVIVPTKLYTTTSTFEVRGEKTVLNLLTDRVKAQVNLTWSSKYINDQYYKFVTRYQKKSIEITWEKHKDYKIGTAKVDGGLIFISSTHRSTTLAFSYTNSEQREGVLWNPIGWTRQTADGDSRITYHDDRAIPVTIGTTFGILIVILLAAIISHQIYIRRKVALTIERTDGRSGEHEITSAQDQPQDNPNETTM